MSTLDTHTIFKTLITRGFTEEQAEGIVYVQEQKIDELVTKRDLMLETNVIRSEIAEVKTEITEIKSDMRWIKGLLFLVIGLIAGLWFK